MNVSTLVLALALLVTVLLNIEQNDRIDALETQVAEMQR